MARTVARKAVRRSRGEGSVAWNSYHGYWEGYVYGPETDGVAKKVYKRSKVEGRAGERIVEDLLEAALKEAETVKAAEAEANDPSNYTLWQAVTDWLDWMGEQKKVGENTLNNKLRVHADIWIKPRIGDVPLPQVDLAVLLDFLEAIAPDLGDSSIGTVAGICRRSINHAMRNKRPTAFMGLIPNKGIELPTAGHQPRARDWLTPEQVELVLNACEGDVEMYALMMTGIYTGLRPQELRALQWGDIEDRTQHLYVVRYLKTGTSRRGIPMSDDVAEALKALRAVSTSETVFTRDGGIPLTKDALAWRVGKVFRAAGLTHRDPYIMRHTFASICDHNKVRHQDIADMMGHANLSTFNAVYRHMMYPEVNQTAAQMNAIFGRRKKAAA
jgi:integrase